MHTNSESLTRVCFTSTSNQFETTHDENIYQSKVCREHLDQDFWPSPWSPTFGIRWVNIFCSKTTVLQIHLSLKPEKISALAIANTDLGIKMVQSLDDCADDVKGAYLRALLNSFALIYMDLIDKILKQCGESILKWLTVGEANNEGLSKDETFQTMATVMRIHGNTSWFESDNEGGGIKAFAHS